MRDLNVFMVVTLKNLGCNAKNLVYCYQRFGPIFSFPEDGDTKFLRHITNDLRKYMASDFRRQNPSNKYKPFFFNFTYWGGGVQQGPLGTSDIYWPIIPASGDYDDEEFGGMKIDRGNRSTRRKPAPAPLCAPQILLDQTRV
jgi:hypothetical protein